MQFDMHSYQAIMQNVFSANKDMNVIGVHVRRLISNVSSEKYIGCVYCKNQHGEEVCVNINNSASQTMLYYPETQKTEFIGSLPNLKFSYTCGAYYEKNGYAYGFPRNSNKLLRININEKTVEEIDIGLDHFKIADKEILYGHHYGGALINDKIILPPRVGANYILCIDLNNYTCKKIFSPVLETNRFNGAILHPNGNIYFMPSNKSSVIEFDPLTENVGIIGQPVPVNLFGGTVYLDGCIYSFSQKEGLYRIDIANSKTELVTDKAGDTPIGGCYGTITHFNGKIYGIPGNFSNLCEYDPVTEKARIYCTFDDGRFNKDKWAGGQLLTNGNIYMVPAFGRFVAEIVFDGEPVISEEMRGLIFSGKFKGM
ncbi:MAG: PQQ-like beta-propeller repeat protein [Lachnospiraceae bacterium]|nr:PQQ-like beta-propeller repeat protein [Lachnospiraceae bacterium]